MIRWCSESAWWLTSLQEIRAKLNINEINELLADLEHQMYEAAKKLDFEYATILRDSIMELKAEYKIK